MILPYSIPLEMCQERIFANHKGSLDLTDLTNQFSLPAELCIPGDLILAGCKIFRLPKIRVAGNANLQDSDVESLTEGSFFGGDLVLDGSHISDIPDNITVGGSLIARNLILDRIGNNLTVLGDAVFSHCTLPDIPASAIFRGNFSCDNAVFRSACPFPERFRVEKILIIDGAKGIERLPFNLNCGSLYARYMTIRLSPGTLIRQDAFFDGSHISGIPEEVSFCGNVLLCKASISRLPRNLHFGGTLNLAECTLLKIPDGTFIGGNLLLDRSRVEVIGKQVVVMGLIYFPKDRSISISSDLKILGTAVKLKTADF